MRVSRVLRCCSMFRPGSGARKAGRRRPLAAVLLGSVLFATLPATGRSWSGTARTIGNVRLGMAAVPVALIARDLAQRVGKVRAKFEKERRNLRPAQDAGGDRVYSRREVTSLITATAKRLDGAIKRVEEPGLAALRAWAAAEFQRLQSQVAEPAATASRRAAPYPVVRVASLAPFSGLAGDRAAPDAAAGRRSYPGAAGSLTQEAASRLLDQARKILETVFVLADPGILQVRVRVVIEPGQGDALIFPSAKRYDKDSGRQLRNGRIVKLWRGLYLWDLYAAKGDPHTAGSCPRSGDEEIGRCKLDFVQLTGSIVCCLPSAPGGPAARCNRQETAGCDIVEDGAGG